MAWHSKQRMASLFKHPYFFHIAPGKTDKQALKAAAKELRLWAKDCEKKAKNCD
jgi:hypothetical protein